MIDIEFENEEMAALKAMQIEIGEWQRKQFPDATLEGAGAHFIKEASEAAEELADCFFMATQCENLGGIPFGIPQLCWAMIDRMGFCAEAVIRAKLEKNKRREWPAKPAADGCYHHTEEAK